MRRVLRHLGLILAIALPAGTAVAGDAATTVLLVRHAEKATDVRTSDPDLSAAGQARAQALAHVAGSAQVAAIYATQYKRTQQTVAPLAALLGLTPVQHPAADVNGLAQAIRTNWSGRTVLVAGHSNTVPQIVTALTGTPMAEIPDEQYDNLYVVVLPPEGGSQVTNLKYGAPTLLGKEP
jgi:2,3-bisphosphoglycerate-dependent phosphoglycerate mutase